MRKPTPVTLTLSARASRSCASPFPMPESEKEPMTPATSGPKLWNVSARYDPNTRSWRTLRASLVTGISEPYSETWPKAGTIVAGELFPQPMWERRTEGIASGYLPTPRANEHGDYTRDKGDPDSPRPTLTGWARMFPTPKAEPRGDCPSERKRRSPSLESAAKMFPTPTADAANPRNGPYAQGGTSLSTAVRAFATPQARDYRTGDTRRWEEARKGERSCNLNDQIGGQLSPDWVSWLMGWPVHWTSLEPMSQEEFDDWMEHQGDWWDEEPPIPRVARKIPNRVARLRALGNGQVSLCAAVAFLSLWYGE